MRSILLLSLFTIGAQCREYFYIKPNVPSRQDNEKHQQEYLAPFTSMTIPGSHGRQFEVSMAPSRNIFEMQLGHHQYYTNGMPNNLATKQQQQHTQQPNIPIPNSQQQIAAPQLANAHRPQQHNKLQHYGNVYQQQPTHFHPQQVAYNPIALATNRVRTLILPPNPQQQQGARASRRQNIFRVCYNSGRCEYVTDNQHLQQILQQSRTKLPSMSQLFQAPTQSFSVANRAQKDRRLFPYSEFPIEKYPFRK